jgi:hypothetical protein
MVVCIEDEAVVGYVAVMLCSIIQVDRPNSSTSGGQSEGAASGVVAGTVGEAVAGRFVDFFIIAIHAAPDVHCLHLLFFSGDPASDRDELTASHPCPELHHWVASCNRRAMV